MSNLAFSVGNWEITPFFWSLLLAVVFSGFSFWRSLKEDYREEEIFGLTLLIFGLSAMMFLLGFLGLKIAKASLLLPLVFWSAVVVNLLWTAKFKKNPWEIFDAFVWPLVLFFVFGGGGLFLKTSSFASLKYSLLGILTLVVFLYSKARYRSFAWYKSGKVGFLFWQTGSILFLGLLVLAFLKTDGLYWEKIIWGLNLGVCLGIIYFRSERVLKEDIKSLLRWRKK